MSGVLDVREFPLFDEENGLGVLAGVDEVRLGQRGHRVSCMEGVVQVAQATHPTS
jgi:hypothetical protein